MSRQSDHARAKIEKGWRRIPVWFAPEDLPLLATLKARYGSEQEAVRQTVRSAACP